ncbi:MAG: hypothetical protein FWH48_12630, partial [Oscillospiraceae bacterium]|nr:hypothetical protein [Oscillospiraceae bacterium]
CRSRAPAEVIAEVNNLLAKGAHDANPAAAAITWTWAWDNSWARDAIDMLCENQIVQCTSEEGLKTNVAGVEGSVLDYTISKPGPGEKSKSLWQHAKNRGLETSAKVQINNTWELSDIPYIPALELIFAHIQSLKALNIQNFQLCWTLGGYPSINMQLVEYILRTPNASTTDFLTEIFGADLGAMVYEAQKSFSEAFAEFPFHIQTAYIAPQNFGVSAPFYLQKTGYSATMIGYPYDDLDGWRAIYPADTYESQMNKVAGQMESSLEKFKKLENLNALLDEMIVFAKAASHKMQSVCNHIKFVRARDSKDRKKMLEAIDNERKTVTELIKLRRRDSRIGFEASNHYLYTKQNLLEKLANLDWCERHILGILKI